MNINLYEWKVNNGITRDIPFNDKAMSIEAPWSWLVSFKRMQDGQEIEVVIVGSYHDGRNNIWSTIPVEDLSAEIKQHIDHHLQLLGFAAEDRMTVLYPSMGDGFFIVKNSKYYPDYNGLAKYFRKELKVKNDDTYSCIYEDGMYRDMSRTELAYTIEKLTKYRCQSNQSEGFKKKIHSQCFYPKNRFIPPEGLVNLNNGVLDIKSKKLLDHSHEYNFRYKLNHDFNPEARASRFIEFLNFIFEEDQNLIRLIGEIMGYTLIGGDPFLHRAFIFHGDGRNGKSTLLDVIKELLGEHSVSSVSMDRLNEPFSVVRMDGKLANIVEEAPSTINSEAFKKIVGGGTVAAARKHMDEYDLKVFARMFFACNDYPHFKDSSKGLKDRLIIIPFKKYIEEEDRDPTIKKKLFLEMSGILNFAIKGYERLMLQGRVFTKAKAVEDSVDEYLSETDSVVSWGKETLTITDNLADRVKVQTMFDSYKEYCRQNGYSTCNNKTFGKRLKRYLVNTFPRNINVDELYGRGNIGRYVMMLRANNKTDILF